MAVQQVGGGGGGGGGARGIEGISSIKRLSASVKRKRRNEHALVPVAVPTKTNSSSLFAEKARACTECGKEFSSWKALFGHMRCHPEREWRGINPPQAVRQERERKLMLMMNNGSEYGGSSHAHHIKSHDTENAHGSRLHPPQEHTARNIANMARQVVTEAESESRESEEKVASHKLHYDDSDTESIEAAYINESINKTKNQHPLNEQLVNLLDTREDKSKQGQVKVKEVNADYSLSDIKEQHDMAHCLVMLASARRPLLTKEDESTSSDNRDSISMSITTKPLESDMAMFPWEVPVLRRESYSSLFQETMLIEAATTPPIKQGTFECGTCNKVFRSHQALGGHRASHKKVKGCFARTNDVSTQESPNEDVITTEYSTKSDENDYNTQRVIVNMIKGTPEESNIAYKPENLVLEDECQWTNLVTKKSKASGGHQCSICSRVFSTGQALGGHKRCHWGTTGDSSTTKGGDQPFATIQTLNTNIDITAPQRTIPSATTPSTIIYQPLMPSKKSDLLDLNLPAPMEDDEMLEHHNCTNENPNYTLTQPVELGVSSSSIIPFDLRIAGELLTLVSGIEKTNTNNGGQQNKDRSLEVTGDYYSRTAQSINRHNFGRCIQCTFCSKNLLSMEEWNDHKRSHNLSPLLSQFCPGEPTF